MDTTALLHIVTAGRTALETDTALRNLGYTDTPYYQIYGNITDAIYAILGENTETFDQSVTCRIMESADMTDAQRAEFLAALCR